MSEWAIKKLSDIASVIDSLHKTPSYVSYGYPMVRVTDIKGGYLDLKGTLKVSETTYKEFSRKYKPKFGDLVFSRVGTYGLTSFVKDDTPFCLGQNTVFIVPNINCYFLFYFLTSPLGKNQIESFVSGSTQKTISLASINNIEVLTPSLEEQKRIADVLSCLDAKIENLRKQNNTLEQIAQTLFKHWFIDFEFPNTDGKPYKSSGGEMQSSVLGDIPKGWRVGKLEDVALLSTGKGIEKSALKDDGRYTVIGANGKIGKTDKFLIDYPVIVTGRVGTIGIINISIKKVWISDNTIIFVPSKNYFYYVYFWLKRTNLKVLNRGSTQPLITQGDLKKLEVIIPSNKIINDYQEISTSLFNKKFKNEEQIETLTKTRDALLPKLMSGQIRIEE